MGIFSELVRTTPGARRTLHPMQSIAALGMDADKLALLDTAGAFDDGSAFDFMLHHDYKVLLLGASIQAVSLVHYSEQRANVPYRYWKDFPGKIKVNGRWEERSYRMFVRDLKIDPKLQLRSVEVELKKENKWRQQSLNYGTIALFSFMDFTNCVTRILREDPWGLVER